MKTFIAIVCVILLTGCTKEYSISAVKYIYIEIDSYNTSQVNLIKVNLKVDSPVPEDTKFRYSFKSNGVIWDIDQTLHKGEKENIFYTMLSAGTTSDLKLIVSNGYTLKQ